MQQAPVERKGIDNLFGLPDSYVGYAVHDPLGRKIGVAEEFFVNAEGEPEYVRTKIWPFGLRSVLLPVQMVATDEERRTIELR